MNKQKTELVLVIDNSGSMQNIRADMEGGLNTLLASQKKAEGECVVTYYRFSSDTQRVYENRTLNEIDEIKIVPDASTALLDAIGLAVDEVGSRLAKTPENERPEKVVFVVITDGEENSSTKFKPSQIKEKIKHQEDKYSWQFIYLGSNQDAFTKGQDYGFGGQRSASYMPNTQSVNSTFNILDKKLTSYRSFTTCSTAKMTFDDQERDEMLTK